MSTTGIDSRQMPAGMTNAAPVSSREMNRLHSRQASAGRSKGVPAPGCLVVLTAGELSVLDLLLTAARRRIPETAFTFPKRIATRRNGPAEAELPVSRSIFRQMEEDGAFSATWQAGGHRFGLPASLSNQLLGGGSAVIAAPADVITNLNDICVDVHTLRLVGGLDAAREPLTPHARLHRILGPRQAARLEARSPALRAKALTHDGDIRLAVRTLTEALVRIERAHRLLRSGIRPAAKPRASGARLRCTPETVVAL